MFQVLNIIWQHCHLSCFRSIHCSPPLPPWWCRCWLHDQDLWQSQEERRVPCPLQCWIKECGSQGAAGSWVAQDDWEGSQWVSAGSYCFYWLELKSVFFLFFFLHTLQPQTFLNIRHRKLWMQKRCLIDLPVRVMSEYMWHKESFGEQVTIIWPASWLPYQESMVWGISSFMCGNHLTFRASQESWLHV